MKSEKIKEILRLGERNLNLWNEFQDWAHSVWMIRRESDDREDWLRVYRDGMDSLTDFLFNVPIEEEEEKENGN
jgi:hypothetical protein